MLPGQSLRLIRADSHDKITLEKVLSIYQESIDFLFIDGDHTYEGVKKDFEMYSPLVVDKGIIAFHDVAPHTPESGCEVNKFWNEIKPLYEHVEIIRDVDQKWAGIGVIKKG